MGKKGRNGGRSSPANGNKSNVRVKRSREVTLAPAAGRVVRPRVLASASPRSDLLQQRKALPVYGARSAVLQRLKQFPCVVIIGETGSGKTTQIPQFVWEAGWCGKPGDAKHCVAITQPRRVAAISVAKRVAEEMGVNVGEEVGYRVRFEDCTSRRTKLKFMTDGMLLREAMLDPKLSRYDTIILDEAHERTLQTDVLFAVVKALRKERPTVRVIIMSATLDPQMFAHYFDAHVMYIEGRQFPVDVMFTDRPQEDYMEAAWITVLQIHLSERPVGDVLVFLPGRDAIETVQRALMDRLQLLPESAPKLLITPIYAALPFEAQMRVFKRTPTGHRKVILATNIAETSITIDGVRFVVDCGLVKERAFMAASAASSLLVQPVSKASARQRSGRAGRQYRGKAFRLYTESTFTTMAPNSIPEIRRCSMDAAILQLKAMNVKDPVTFDYMEAPQMDAIRHALHTLYCLGALDDKMQLTKLGRQMSGFPLSPQLSKVILCAAASSCVSEVVSIVAMFSADGIFVCPPGKQDAANLARASFAAPEGDHMTMLNVYMAYKDHAGSDEAKWCNKNFISRKAMKTAIDIREQLVQYCTQVGIDASASAPQDATSIVRAFVAGFFVNVALREPKARQYRTMHDRQMVHLHPSSTLFGTSDLPPPCVMYNELMLTRKCYMRDVSSIDPKWLLELAPDYYSNMSSE